ncbi:MAG TPA: dehydrogenase, partial [Acetobacteraceae bacterium]|nr:dehydrogenase [Acetobacteraceae bacterium]
MTRRAALLGGAGLLAGCETFDSIFGERREPIVGDRRPVLQMPARRLTPDPALASTPVALPAPAPREAWPQPGGNAAHSGGHPALGATLQEAWRSS